MIHKKIRISNAILRLFAVIAMIPILASACSSDDTIVYNDYSMVNISNGNIISDEGIRFVVDECLCDNGYEKLGRAFFSSDIISHKGNNTFGIRLKDYLPVSVKEAVSSDMIQDAGDDPISLISIWTSASYINMGVLIPYKDKNLSSQAVNLVKEVDRCTQDSLFFTLKHSYGPDLSPVKGIQSMYLSIPYESFIPDGKESIAMSIDWKWESDNAPDIEIEQASSGSVSGTLYRHSEQKNL